MAATVLVLYTAITLVMLTALGYFYGRGAAAKSDLQLKSDAMALTMGEALKRGGPGAVCTHPTVLDMQARYGGECLPPEPIAGPDGTIAGYRLRYTGLEQTIEVPTALFDTREATIRTEAVAEQAQDTIDLEERRAKFVLVLDYSLSMELDINGGNGRPRRIELLKSAVHGLLSRRYPVDVGAVLFSGDVIESLNIARDNDARVDATVQATDHDGSTNYNAALDRAHALFPNDPDNSGHFILFATDGQPTAGGGNLKQQARQRARRIWDDDIKLFTLNIGAQAQFRQLLFDMSGDRDHPGDRGFAFEAGNEAALTAAFDEIVGFIVCRGDIDARAAGNIERVFVSLVHDDGHEDSLKKFRNRDELTDPVNEDEAGYIVEAVGNGNHRVVLNQVACEPILDGNAHMVMRYRRPTLVAGE